MKRIAILLTSAALLFVTLTSYKAGPSGTPSGVNTAKTGCGGSGCHGTSYTPVNMTLQLIEDGQSTQVSDGKYKPNATYMVSFSLFNSTALKFGYIMLITDASNNQAGVLDNPFMSPQYKITNKGQYIVAEQPSAQNPIAGGTGAIVEWTAPAKGRGAVTVYVAVNACNGNGNADTGDHWALKSVTLQEGWPVSLEDVQQQISVSVYPNPATNLLNIEAGNTLSMYSYTVYNLSGAITAQGNFSGKTSVDVSSLATGVHFVKITDGTNQQTIIFNTL